MFGMGQGLELADLGGSPIAEGGSLAIGVADDAGEELCLAHQGFGAQAFGFAGFAEDGEVDVGGEVLFAGVDEQVAGLMVAMTGAEVPCFRSGVKNCSRVRP